MDAVTHPHEQVEAAIASGFVPVKLEAGKNSELQRRVGIRWLPGTVVVDLDDRVAHAQTGFLPPGDLLVELKFARAISAMAQKRYDDAHALFGEVAETPDAERAPEAYFWWGISRYRHSKDFLASVKAPWGAILEKWPRSQWARKVGFALEQPAKID